MTENVRIKVTMLDNSKLTIDVKAETLKSLGGLPSGKVVTMRQQTGDVQYQEFLVRPYYRRIMNDTMHIFAVQVTIKGGVPHA